MITFEASGDKKFVEEALEDFAEKNPDPVPFARVRLRIEIEELPTEEEWNDEPTTREGR